MSTQLLNTYAEPPNGAQFSRHFFDTLTFGDLPELVLPASLAPGAMYNYEFFPSEPTLVSSKTVAVGDLVPSALDLKPVLGALPSEFSKGSRAVVLKIRAKAGARPIIYTCHFQKIKMFSYLNANRHRIEDCRALFDRVASDDFPLSAADTVRFASRRLTSRINGLTSLVHWYDLASLLDEAHVWDDIADGRAEITQFRQVQSGQASQAWFSAMLLRSASMLYNSVPRVYSQNLLDIRHLIRSGAISGFFVVHIADSHATVYHWTGTDSLGFGDTLGRPPAAEMLEVLNWLLDGLAVPVLSRFTILAVPTQPSDSGSCVVASCNTIERMLGTTTICWTHGHSQAFRGRMIVDFIMFSNLVEDHGPFEPPHYTSGISREEISSHVGAICWEEWNLSFPTAEHPIVRFLPPAPPLARFPKAVVAGQPPTNGPPAPQLPSSQTLLPAFTLDNSATTSENRRPSHGPIGKNQPSRYQTTARANILPEWKPFTSETTTAIKDTIFKTEIMDDIAEMFSSDSEKSIKSESTDEILPSTPRASSSECIDLTMSSPAPATPPRPSKPLKHAASPLSPPIRKRAKGPPARAASIIEISSDSDAGNTNAPRAFKREPRVDPETAPVKKEESDSDLATAPASWPPGLPSADTLYATLEEAIKTVYAHQEQCGYKFRLSQSKKLEKGSNEKRKQTLRCTSAYLPAEQHSHTIDPADHRQSKTIRTGCKARVNINRVGKTQFWRITLAELAHNHDRVIPPGGVAVRPASAAQRELVARFATSQTFSRRHIAEVVEHALPGSKLEPRQISNLVNAARSEARAEVLRLGGDVHSVVAKLEEYKRQDPRWTWSIQLDEDGRVTGLFWQSPEQVQLVQSFPDLLLIDNAYNRNQYQFSLNIGVVIDGANHSRNAYYAFQEREDVETHMWILGCYLDSVGELPPDVVFSDRHAALEIAIPRRFPTAEHFFCIDHLQGNIAEKLASLLGVDFGEFVTAFWKTYWAASPEEFDTCWRQLLERFPAARPYLDEHIYPIRQKWAWAWLSFTFTAGTRTTGRVESENRVNKAFGGPKVPFLQLFNNLNQRTLGQTARESLQFRQNSRRHHDTNLESVFRYPLQLLRQHAGPFAMHKSYEQMKASLFYNVSVLRLPSELRSWTAAALGRETLPARVAEQEQGPTSDPFAADAVYIATKHMLDVAASHRLPITHLLAVTHAGSQATHVVAIIDSQRLVCDCMMLSNMGIPCRHIFAAWRGVQGMPFHIGLINRRWLNDRFLDLGTVAPVTATHTAPDIRFNVPADRLANALSNPLGTHRQTPAPQTTTLDSRTIYHEAQAALKPLLNRVQTMEQLQELVAYPP